MPTPPLAPLIRIVLPGLACAASRHCSAVEPASGIAAAASKPRPVGRAASSVGQGDGVLGERAAALPEDPVAGLPLRGLLADRDDDTGEVGPADEDAGTP